MVFNPRAGQPAPNTVDTAQLVDGAVTSEKVGEGVNDNTEQANQVNYQHTGITIKRFERFEFFKDTANRRNLKKLRVYCDLKGDGVNNATLGVWLDNDGDWDGADEYTGAGAADGTFVTNSAVLVNGYLEVNITGLADGKHSVNMSLVGATAPATAETNTREYTLDKSGN